jgi:hypothetical protein
MLKGDQLTSEIIGSAIEVHRNIGPVYWSQPMRSVWYLN